MLRTAHSRALPFLLLANAAVLAVFPLLSEAPNRLLSGKGKTLLDALTQAGTGWWAGAAAWGVVGVLLLLARQWPEKNRLVSCGALLWLAGLVWGLCGLCGSLAAAHQEQTGGLGRTSFSSGFSLTLVLVWLMANELLRYLHDRKLLTISFWAVLVAGVLVLLTGGYLDALSTLKEYTNRQEDFWRALQQHLLIIGWTVGLTVAAGLPMGIGLHRQPAWAARVFPALNLVQTIPSIALFGLLMAALAWLGAVFPVLPAWGIHGIGLAPAVLALTLYSLLPLVRSVVEGLANVPVAAVESAHAMGMVGRQRLWQVELPLAAPVILSGLKVMLVQTIGLAAVAALIGAGGLGALMFEGLFSSALDLVVLAVAPLVVLAWCAEALFAAMAALFPTWIRR
jgi:osmoprotectant transport system permease protein